MEEKILKLFKKRPDDFLSGEQISEDLNISRAAVWKYIEKLRILGYDIDAVPHLGYRFKSSPDKLYPMEIGCGLNTHYLGRKIIYYDSIPSTNTAAFEIAIKGAREGTVIIADTQTKGKGRLMREWASPKGKGIYASVILRPDITPYQAPRITITAAVSCALALRDFCGVKASIKWPNDILVGRHKIGGILTEMDAESDHVNFIILGIGININSKKTQLPKGATSILEETQTQSKRADFVRILFSKIEEHYNIFKQGRFNENIEQWCALSATLGNRVRSTCMHRKIEGEAVGIDSDGALIIRLDNGFQEKVLAGDVTLLR